MGSEEIDARVEEGVLSAILDGDGAVVVVAKAVDSEKALMRTSLGVWTALEAVEGSNVTHSVTVAIQALELTARQEKSMAWWRMRISALLRAVYTDTLDEDGEKECTTPQRMTRMAKSVCVPNGQDRRAIPTFPLRWRSADLVLHLCCSRSDGSVTRSVIMFVG